MSENEGNEVATPTFIYIIGVRDSFEPLEPPWLLSLSKDTSML